MIAEFYGLPGSGKSTLMRKLLQEENGKIQKKRTGKSIPVIQHLFNALSPEFLGFAVKCIGLYRSKKEKWEADGACIRSLLEVYLIYMWERKHGGREYHCYDHGIIQSCAALIWTEFYIRDGVLDLAEYFCRNMHPAVKLVYLQSGDYERIYQRMVDRGDYRRIIHRLEKEQTMEVLQFQNDFFNEVFTIADKYGMCIRVNAMDSIENSAAVLRAGLCE